MSKLKDHSQRAHALLSASSAARWLACPPSAVAAEAYENEGTEYTREGTLAHEVAEIYAKGGSLNDTPWPDGIDKEMVDCAEAYADYIQEQIKSPDAVVLLEQIRTLDKRRLREKMGRVDRELMDRVDAAIAVSFGLHDNRTT